MDAKIHLLPVCELISEVAKVSDQVAKTNAIADDQLLLSMCLLPFLPRVLCCVKTTPKIEFRQSCVSHEKF